MKRLVMALLLLWSGAAFRAATVVFAQAAPESQEARVERGRQLFQRRCTGCHSLDAEKEGPRLRTVYGRRAGSVPGFEYSEALKRAQFTWDEATLDRWLRSTQLVAPGNNMDFRVPVAEERTAIIAFLKSQAAFTKAQPGR